MRRPPSGITLACVVLIASCLGSDSPTAVEPGHVALAIQPALVAQLAARLQRGGYIHCATDWKDYAQQILDVLGAEPQLANSTGGYAPRPEYRPLTKFENRGLKLGHGVWDLVFLKV